MKLRYSSAAAAALALVLAPAPASAAAPSTSDPVEERLETLRAGQFVWQPERSDEGPVEIVISLADQRALVFRGGTLIGASTISSGREGYESPIGRFHILQKRREHRSNRYNSAPMPFMQRLNWYGVALHGGEVPDRPASHGCIRLPMGFARHLFGATELGTFVFVTPEPFGSPAAALNLARAHVNQPIPADRTPEWAMGSR